MDIPAFKYVKTNVWNKDWDDDTTQKRNKDVLKTNYSNGTE
jgi:hypothetical protein